MSAPGRTRSRAITFTEIHALLARIRASVPPTHPSKIHPDAALVNEKRKENDGPDLLLNAVPYAGEGVP